MIRKFAELLGISKQPKKEVETQTTLLQKKANTFAHVFLSLSLSLSLSSHNA